MVFRVLFAMNVFFVSFYWFGGEKTEKESTGAANGGRGRIGCGFRPRIGGIGQREDGFRFAVDAAQRERERERLSQIQEEKGEIGNREREREGWLLIFFFFFLTRVYPCFYSLSLLKGTLVSPCGGGPNTSGRV